MLTIEDVKQFLSVKFVDLPEYGDHMTIEKFRECVAYGGFIDYDGSGNFATATQMSNFEVSPSAFPSMEVPKWATHVVWFNR